MNMLTHPRRLFTQATLAVLVLAAVHPAYAAGTAVFPGTQTQATAAAPLTPPIAALHANGVPGTGIHALGFLPNPAVPRAAQLAPYILKALPGTVDLSQFDPPVGDQGGVDSCVSWATGYYLRGWYARRDGYYPAGGTGGTGSYSPMFLYSQLVHGQNVGTYFSDNLNLLEQGIDTRADYGQGDYDYWDLPTAAERANASHIRIASYTNLGGGPNLQSWIESTMAGGNPVVLGIPIYPEFDRASASNPLVGLPLANETSRGGHAVFASKYDANGVWVENQWGTSWGLNGWAELSWAFISQYAYEGVSEVPMLPGGVVPSVVGRTSTAGIAAVRAAGFGAAITSAVDRTCNYLGRIMSERPGAGAFANLGSTVTLTIGSRPRTPCP